MFYRTGIESVVAYATETMTGGMLAPDSTTIAAPGTLALAGYTNVAGYTRTNALRRLRAAGMARPTTPRPGAKNSTITLTPTLSGGTLSKAFLNKALRGTAGATGTFKCMDTFIMAIATRANCGDGAATQELARCCQFNTLTLNIQRDAYLNYSAEIWPLFIDPDPATPATMPTISDAAFGTAGGNPFVFEDMTFTLGGEDLTAYIAGAQINVNNMLQRMGTRAITQGAPLAFNPGQIVTAGEEVTINLSLFDRVDEGVLDSYGTDNGALSIVLTDGVETMTIAATANWVENTGQQGGEATSQMMWSASLLSADLSIT